MRSLFIATAAAGALIAGPTLAQDGMFSGTTGYGSLGYSSFSAEEADDVDLGSITGRLGARVNPWLGAEAEVGVGVKGEEIGGADVDLNYHAAAYAVGFVPMSENLDLFARVGVGVSEIEVSGAGASLAEDGQSLNYGVGAQYFFDGRNGVRGDWTRHDFEDDGGEADVWSLSYVRRF